MWATQRIWMMLIRVDDKECPNQGRHELCLRKREEGHQR
jgi:hypothetical protein